jgi:hypothetical protein
MRVDTLRRAVAELGWLLERGYAQASACKLVGDRHRLHKRQRIAVVRCACANTAARRRAARRIGAGDLRGRAVAIDGFNVLITVEAALSGGVVLRGADRVVRDLASVHGSYRRVAVTHDALDRITAALRDSGVHAVTWLLDRPVSNSARLAQTIETLSPPEIETWTVELPFDADAVLRKTQCVVATSDSAVLDECGPWIDLGAEVIERSIPSAWIVDLGEG